MQDIVRRWLRQGHCEAVHLGQAFYSRITSMQLCSALTVVFAAVVRMAKVRNTSLPSAPAFLQARHGQRRPVLSGNGVSLLALWHGAPFIKCVHGHQAALQ